jgi:RIO kinase 1
LPNLDFTKQYNKLKNQLQAVVEHNIPSNPKIKSKETPAAKSNSNTTATPAATQAAKAHPKAFDKALSALSKFATRIQVSDFQPGQAPSLNISRKGQGDRERFVDKEDRATVEQVLDPRTRIILFKLLNRGVFYQINGCISTGKEANVYHATTQDNNQLAIKIYKTSILTFKDRDRYVSGEYRFRHGYSKSNPRKMVKLWAEKELRNLKRLAQAGIPCPNPLLVRMHVLVMDFLGSENGWAYPRLKDAKISQSRYPELYIQLIHYMHKMYHECHLVHADLSEYNILYHNKQLYLIDVSQSVEHDHPHAVDFLRMDCTNVTDYFKKKKVNTIAIKDLFELVTNPRYSTFELVSERVEELLVQLEQLSEAGRKERDLEDEVFKKTFIPRNLEEVYDVERDAKIVSKEGAQTVMTFILYLFQLF